MSLLGVVVRFEDLHQAVQCCVRTFTFGTQHHHVTVGSAQAHQGKDAGGVHGVVGWLPGGRW